MNIRGVFTEIPLFNDGEGNEDKATIYAGAPISEKDSVFNMGDIFEKYGNSTQAFISSYESYIQSFEKESKQASQMRETAINKMCNYLENSRGSAESFFGFFREMRGFIANEVRDSKNEYRVENAQRSQRDILMFELDIVRTLEKRQQSEKGLNVALTDTLAVELFDLAFDFDVYDAHISGSKRREGGPPKAMAEVTRGFEVESFLGALLLEPLKDGLKPEKTVPIIYALMLHAIESKDEKKIKYILAVLGGQTHVCTTASDLAPSIYAGIHYFSQDTPRMNRIANMTYGITEAISLLTNNVFPEEEFIVEGLGESVISALHNARYNAYCRGASKNDQARFEVVQLLQPIIADPVTFQQLLFSYEDWVPEFSATALQQSRLLYSSYEYLFYDKEKKAEYFFYIPGIGITFLVRDEIEDFHQAMQNLLRKAVTLPNSEVFTPENSIKYLTTVAKYNRPEIITSETIKTIYAVNKEYKDGMFLGNRPKKERSIPKKGVKVRITDSELTAYGYESITFKPGDNGYIHCEFRIGEYDFCFYIDNEGGMQDLPNCDNLSKKIMANMVLAHLDDYMCTTKDSLRGGMTSREFKKFESAYLTTKEPFRRHLVDGRVPSITQMELALEDSNWRHLPTLNMNIIVNALSAEIPDVKSMQLEEVLEVARNNRDILRQKGVILYTYVKRHDVSARNPDAGDPLDYTSHVSHADYYGSNK